MPRAALATLLALLLLPVAARAAEPDPKTRWTPDDVLLTERRYDAERVATLVSRVVQAADLIEERLLRVDQPMETFQDDLELEPTYDR